MLMTLSWVIRARIPGFLEGENPLVLGVAAVRSSWVDSVQWWQPQVNSATLNSAP
jgi:hypothetical protein